MKALLGITCGTVLVCGFAVVQASARETKRAVLQVTVRATVSKNWNAVTETMQGDCPASVHSTGRRKVVLRSARLTRVVVRHSRAGVLLSGRRSLREDRGQREWGADDPHQGAV
jgi:hypothetical protein